MWALIYSKFVITVAMICLLALSVFNIDLGKKQPLGFHPHLRQNFQKFFSNKAYLAVTLFFLIILFSGINSEDMSYWGERLRIKLPFILLPFAFVSMPRFREQDYLTIFYFFLILLFGSTLLVGFDYWVNYENIPLVDDVEAILNCN